MAEQPIDPSAMIDRVASQQMGVKPEMPQGQEQTQPPVPQQAAEKAPEVPTDQEKAITEGSPETEGDRMSAEAILYEIDFGDGETRKLSPHQISETFKRYRDVNHKQAQNANLNRVVEAAIKNGIAKSPDDAARMILNAIKANQSNPQMGDDDGKTNVQAKADTSLDALAQWEEDNAVTLPPGFRENAAMIEKMGANMNQLQQMLGQVLQQSQGNADAAARQGVEAQNMKGQAIKQAIANNLDRAAQATGLTEDQAEDFRIFAYERGYTEDDFVDGQLTAKVMNDYKNSVQSPEMDRLREINKRRQAFTGSVVQTPTSGDAGGEANPPATTLDRLAAQAMNRPG